MNTIVGEEGGNDRVTAAERTQFHDGIGSE
jgi:hypothetical protein